MKNLLLSLLFLISFSTFSQQKTKQEKREECIRSTNYSFKKRLSLLSVDSITEIKVVSHITKVGVYGDSLQKYFNNLKVKEDYFNEKEFHEVETLTLSQIEKLTDIFFNYNNKSGIVIAKGCYMPRNAIIFLDKNQKILGYIEICFECLNYRTSDEALTIGSYCSEKYDLIKAVFKESGITYGITTW